MATLRTANAAFLKGTRHGHEGLLPGRQARLRRLRRVHDRDRPAGARRRRRLRAGALRSLPRLDRHLRRHLRARLHAAARHRPRGLVADDDAAVRPGRWAHHQDRPRASSPGGLPGEISRRGHQRHEPVHGQEAPAPATGVRDHNGGRLMADAFRPEHAERLEDPARLAALPRLAEMLRAKLTPELAERLEIVETDDNTVPEPDGVADRVVMVDVLHHLYDQPGALAEVTRLLRPGGLFVVADWGDKERPIGPPLDHVLGLAAVRGVIAGMGLEEVEAHEPGTLLPHHLAFVAAKS